MIRCVACGRWTASGTLSDLHIALFRQVYYKNLVYRYTAWEMPDELNTFWQLVSLQELQVSHNSLFELPESISRMHSLTKLDAS